MAVSAILSIPGEETGPKKTMAVSILAPELVMIDQNKDVQDQDM